MSHSVISCQDFKAMVVDTCFMMLHDSRCILCPLSEASSCCTNAAWSRTTRYICEYVVMMQLFELKQHGPSHKRIANKTLKSILVTSKFKSQCLYRCLFCILFFQLLPAKTPSAPKLILQQGHAEVCVMQVGHSSNPHYFASLIAIWSAAA